MRTARFTLRSGEPIALPPERLGIVGDEGNSKAFTLDDEPHRDYDWELRDPFERAAAEVDAARAEFPPVVVVGNNNAVGTEADIEKCFPLRTLTQEGGPERGGGAKDWRPTFARVLHNQAFETAAVRLERMVAGSDHEDVDPEVAVRRVLSDLLAQLEVTVEGGAS